MLKTRSFLKWAGGKYNCLNHILPSLPSAHRLIEPFVGSGVIFMNTHYPSYLLAEQNTDLIDLYNILQDQGSDFIDFCEQFFNSAANCKEYYYEKRTQFNELCPSLQRSAFFLYLNRHGYNGLCRYNSKGLFNVPFGLYTKPYFPREEMLFFHQKSQQVQFLQADFRNTFKLAEKGDVIYCDPPYVPLYKQTRTISYTQQKFTDLDQIELAELAQETAAKGIPVIISNHDTEFTRFHYQKALIQSFNVSRWINCNADERLPAKELIAIFN